MTLHLLKYQPIKKSPLRNAAGFLIEIFSLGNFYEQPVVDPQVMHF